MSVRISPVSRAASVIIIIIGALTLLAGWTTGTLADTVAGVAFIVLGVALYGLLYRLSGQVRTASSKQDS